MSIVNEHSQRLHSWHRLVDSIAQRPYLFAAMAFYWIWTNMGYQTPIVFRPIALGTDFVLPSQAGPLFMSFLSYLVISAWFKRTRKTFPQSGFPWLVSALMSAASTMLIAWLDCTMATVPGTNAVTLASDAMAQLSPLLYGVGSLLFGLSAACMCIEMQRVFGSLGSEHVLFHGSVAMLGSVLVIFLLAPTPSFLQQAVFAIAPLPIAFCLVRSRGGFTKQDLFNRGVGAELNIPYKLLVTALLHGLSFGILLGNPLMQQNAQDLLAWSIVSYAAAALLMLFTAISFKLNFNNLIYQIGFPLVAFGMYVSIVLGINVPAGASVQLAGFCFLHLIMWGACAFLIKNFNLPATWVIGTSTCLFMAGQLCGALVSGLSSHLFRAAGQFDTVALTTLFIILSASLFMMSNKNLRTGWGLAKPDTYRASSEEQRQFTVRTLASESELTKREADILESLLKGKNRKTISEEACVSTETVKSHIQNIYKKVGVHSQQELIKLVEERSMQLGG